ncbi:MAG TPA: hypothetical protein VF263_03075 [Longimicrobiaceae bacterium]
MRFVLLGAEAAPRFGAIVSDAARSAGLRLLSVARGEWGSAAAPAYRLEEREVVADMWLPVGEAGLGGDDHLWAFDFPAVRVEGSGAQAEYLHVEWRALTWAFLQECPAHVWNRFDLLSPVWTLEPLPFLLTELRGLSTLRTPDLACAAEPPGAGWRPWPRSAAGGSTENSPNGSRIFWRVERPGPLHLAVLVGEEALTFRVEPSMERCEAPAELLADLRTVRERRGLDYLEALLVPEGGRWTALRLGTSPGLVEAVAEGHGRALGEAVSAHLARGGA